MPTQATPPRAPCALAAALTPPAPEAPGTPATPQAALRQALARLERAETQGRPGLMADACQRLARCYRALGASGAARASLERALRWACTSGAADQELDLRCEFAEWLADEAAQADRHEHGSGRALREQARDQVFQASRLAAGCADPRWEVTLLLRLSDVLDRFGDRDDATVLQVRALQLTVSEVYAPPAPRAEDAVSLRRH